MNMAVKSGSVDPLTCTSMKDKVSEQEWQIRCDLALMYRIFGKFGFTDLGGTHLSARIPGPENHFLLNPFGVLFEEVTASSLVKIDCDGNVVGDSEFSVNTAGFVIHSAIHMARHDVMCVAHTHTVPGIALSCLKEGFLPVSQHAMRFYNRVSYHDWEGVATNLDERERLVADLGPTNMAMILRNHGLLTCGRTIQEAWKHMFYMEKSAEAQLKAMAAAHGAGKKLLYVGPDVGEYTAEGMNQRSNTEYGNMDWPALKRLQDVADPSYMH